MSKRAHVCTVALMCLLLACTASAEQVPISTADQEIPRLFRDLQRSLNARGYDAGPVDGQFGPRTKAAMQKFQADQGISGQGLDKVAEKLGFPLFKSCFWFGPELKCPLGCSASILASQDGVRGYAVDCPGYDTTTVPLPR